MSIKHLGISFKRHAHLRSRQMRGWSMLGALVCQVLLAWTVHADAAWLDNEWSNRQMVTISGTLATTETLTNFPVLVQLSDQANALFLTRQTNGLDIVFTAADGVTRLAHEIDTYSAQGTKIMNAWVRIPELIPAVDTVLYMYYGNPTATLQQDKATLWADYVGVWHLGEDEPGTNTAMEVYKDSTTNAFHGKDYVSTNSAAGRIGNGANLDGDDYIALKRALYTTDDFTITAWVRPTRLAWEPIIGDLSSRYFTLISASTLLGRSAISNSWHDVVTGGNANLKIDAWQHVVFRSTGEAGTSRSIYQNGTNVTAGTHYALVPPLDADPWTMIGKWSTTYFFHGVLDEVRVSDKALPPAWFEAECRNATSPSSFVSFSPEEGTDAVPWPATFFKYRQEIWIWPDDSTAALTNFPLLVAITNQNNHVFSTAAADGHDILFTAVDGVTHLSYEIEQYTATAPASLFAWVRVPVLRVAAPTRLYMYYGRSRSFDQPAKTNVWSEGYLGVWHLNEAVSNNQTNYDSSANAKHGVFKDPNGRGGGNAVGKIAGADAFQGFDDHYVLTPGILCSSNGFTISAWVNYPNTNLFGIYESGTGNNGYTYSGISQGAGIASVATDLNQKAGYTLKTIKENTWHHLTAVCAPPNVRLYRDGSYEGSSPVFTNLYNQIRGSYIGRYTGNGNAFNGRVDELRISGVARTPEWIRACYLSQSEPGARLSFQAPEVSVAVGTLLSIF